MADLERLLARLTDLRRSLREAEADLRQMFEADPTSFTVDDVYRQSDALHRNYNNINQIRDIILNLDPNQHHSTLIVDDCLAELEGHIRFWEAALRKKAS